LIGKREIHRFPMMPASSDAIGMTASHGFHNREGCDWSVVSRHEESSDFMVIVVGSDDFS
jgi:hypothetical protein